MADAPMRRVTAVGGSGAGESAVARKLGKRLQSSLLGPDLRALDRFPATVGAG
jgi:hypothetical protein